MVRLSIVSSPRVVFGGPVASRGGRGRCHDVGADERGVPLGAHLPHPLGAVLLLVRHGPAVAARALPEAVRLSHHHPPPLRPALLLLRRRSSWQGGRGMSPLMLERRGAALVDVPRDVLDVLRDVRVDVPPLLVHLCRRSTRLPGLIERLPALSLLSLVGSSCGCCH